MPQVRALLQHGGAQAGELNACADPTAVAASATDAERHSEWAQAQETVQSEVEQKLRQLEALREPEVVQKQLKLAQGRTLHAELAQCSCNIKDVGTALGVVVGFLSVMDCKRDALGRS